tara:strand:- start:66248 stop:67816 length:1569 start_codon:yes stop_codon:yes gene_type:complete
MTPLTFLQTRGAVRHGMGLFTALFFPLVFLMAMPLQAREFTLDGDFSRDTLINMARELAKEPYQPAAEVPDELGDLEYDEYRAIRFRPGQSVWADQDSPYRMQMFHPGFFYKQPVEIAIVEDGKAQHLPYSADFFSVDPPAEVTLPDEDIGYAGLRLHTPLNNPDIWDELIVFQGASYFRSLGRGQLYGLSARGLAVKTGSPEGEEFPIFRAFWIEKPTPGANAVVVHALLDSDSVTGAYRFTIRPGDSTQVDIEATLFPRVEMTDFGLAPGTSMYYFGPNDRLGIDDFRPRVHDSDGLLMKNGNGQRIWRPLSDPDTLQMSAFVDTSPMGFGLIQRERDFNAYQDLEAHYEKRPNLWVEPLGDWGAGQVVLTEIPTNSEIHDNIVAFWKPEAPMKPGQSYSFAYRLTWGEEPIAAPEMLRVEATRIGRADIAQPTPRRLVIVDYAARDNQPLSDELPKVHVETNNGQISNVVVRRHPGIHGYRVAFELDPQGAAMAELRLTLTSADERPAEHWVYRWTEEG